MVFIIVVNRNQSIRINVNVTWTIRTTTALFAPLSC